MRDPQRIPDVMGELARTWEAQPDVTLAHVWAQLEARGVALNSSDVEVVEALRAVRRDFPFSLCFPDATAGQPACVFIETEGPVRKVSLNFVGDDQAWIVVRSMRKSGHTKVRGAANSFGEEPQPGVWQVSELVTCRAGLPLQVKDLNGITHRLGVVKHIRAIGPEKLQDKTAEFSLSGMRSNCWAGDTYLACLKGNTTALIDRNIRLWEQARREIHTSVYRWRKIHKCENGTALEFTDNSGTQRRFDEVIRVFRVS